MPREEIPAKFTGRVEVLEPKVGPAVLVSLTGQLFAVYSDDGSPVLLDLPGLGPCFTLFGCVEDLRDYMSRIGIAKYRLKQVADGHGFMKNQIPVPIVCNMRFDSVQNKSKWTVVRPMETA